MELKKYLNTYILGVIGSVLLIISEFFSWFTDYSLIEIYVISSSVAIEDSFLYLFPLMSGIICLIASSLVIYKIELKIKCVIIFFVGLGFLIIFFIDYITQEISYISNANIGFYLGVIGFLLILFNIINILITIEK
ncbi:MAG: hypothetical protein E3J52_08725 [Promethearchaeota archaeon]|nr:MAG: hypothetical protein E3J52_08725 [Candidatus Lokiarchaeota archaeon]